MTEDIPLEIYNLFYRVEKEVQPYMEYIVIGICLIAIVAIGARIFFNQTQ